MATQTPAQVLDSLLKADPAAPRITFYERTPGATFGERIELSGKVLANWVAKAANMLIDELDITSGDDVIIDLPAAHWRTAYWALAAWSTGASVEFVDADHEPQPSPTSQVLVTCRPQDGDMDQIVVTLAALARSSSQPVPDGSFDEALEVSTFSDFFTPMVTPDADEILLRDAGGEYTCAALCVGEDGGRRYLAEPSLVQMMKIWAAGGSIVLIRGDMADAELARILAQEETSA